MARIFIEVLKDAEPHHINESDWEIAFQIAPSLDDEKMKVAEEYESDRGNNMFALDYYAMSDFPKELQEELIATITKECGDIQLEIDVEAGLPSPNWAYRAMDTDYTLKEAEADWFKDTQTEPKGLFTVMVMSEVYGREFFRYDTLHEALAAIERLHNEAVAQDADRNANDYDSIERVIGLVMNHNPDNGIYV